MDTNQELGFMRKRNRRLSIIVFILLIGVFLAEIGILLAFFSDIITKNGTVKTGTLDITGTYTYYINGVLAEDPIENLNPGDVIVISAAISNTGNKSAWVREVITFNNIDAAITDYLFIYEGTYTMSEIVDGDADEDNVELSESGVAATLARVLNGTGDNAETESGGGFDYIGSSAYNFSLSVYFDSQAGNSAQDKTFDFTIKTQALQFRNNNEAVPEEDAWATVVTSPFGN